MPNRVDAAVNAMEVAVAQSMLASTRPEAQSLELKRGDHSVLIPRDDRDCAIDRANLGAQLH